MRLFDAAVAASVLGVFAVMVVTAAGYPQAARLVPLVVGVPATLLAAWQLWREWAALRSPEVVNRAGRDRHQARREALAIAWFVLFVLLVIAGGFPVGGTIGVTLSQRLWLRESWRTAVIGGAVAFVILYAGIERGLGLVLFEGLVARWLA